MSKYNISENTKKYKFVPLYQRAPVLLICVIIFGFLSKAAWNAYLENKRSMKAAATAKMELAELEAREVFVSEELEKLKTAGGREALLREKFGVGRPGEQVAIIVDGTNNDSDSSSGPDFWSRIKSFFSVLFQK